MAYRPEEMREKEEIRDRYNDMKGRIERAAQGEAGRTEKCSTMAMDTVGRVSIREQLEKRKAHLSDELAHINEALLIMNAHPEIEEHARFQEIMDTLRRRY